MRELQNKVMNIIIDNFSYEMNTIKNRNKIINNLNRVFFSDKIAKFIDTTNDEEIDNGTLSFMIEYKGNLYNLLAFEDIYFRIERMRKLKKLNQ
jgi:hypothetical protein